MELGSGYLAQPCLVGQISTIFRNRYFDMGFKIGTEFQPNFRGSARSSEGDAERDTLTWD